MMGIQMIRMIWDLMRPPSIIELCHIRHNRMALLNTDLMCIINDEPVMIRLYLTEGNLYTMRARLNFYVIELLPFMLGLIHSSTWELRRNISKFRWLQAMQPVTTRQRRS